MKIGSRASVSLILLCFGCMSGCTALQKEFRYELQQNRWKEIDHRLYEIEIGSQTVKALIEGEWAGWDFAGPLFFPPFLPIPKDKKLISVELFTDKTRQISLSSASLILDGKQRLEPHEVHSRQNLIGDHIAAAMYLRPWVEPESIRVEFHGVKLDAAEIQLPPLSLLLKTRRCLWYGDSTEHVVGCSSWD